MASFSLTNQKDTLYAITAFLTALAVYALTLCPTVYVGDSGEFITTAATLGINHPTGYTLHTLGARAVILLTPFWTAVYAVNFFSAFCSALTVVCLYYLCSLLSKQKEIALACSLAFGFSYTFWSRATIAEVYSLNIFFIALSIYLTLRWYYSQRTIDLVLLAYTVGLGLSQHVTGALAAPVIIVFILLKHPAIVRNFRLLVALLFFAALGFSAYLYLPIRTAADPPLDWGNPENIKNIIGHFFPQSGSNLFGETSTGGGLSSRLAWFADRVVTKEFWYVGVFSVFGLFALGRKHWRLVVLFLGIAGLNVYFTIARKLPLFADFDAYFLPSFFVMGVLISLAASWGWTVLSTRIRAFASSPALKLSSLIVLLAVPALLLKLNYSENDKSQNWFGYDFGKNVLATVPPNAVLITVGDEQSFISWYFKYVEKYREDITIIDGGMLGAIWGASHMYNRELNLPIRESDPPEVLARQIISATFGTRPVVFVPRVPWPSVTEGYDFRHAGMTMELLPQGSRPAYEPTDFAFHPDWEKQFFDERSKLIVQFYYKEFIDNAKYWYSKGNALAAKQELDLFWAFPYRHNDRNDIREAFLLGAVMDIDNEQFGDALAQVDSAEAYGTTDYRVHEMRGNIKYLMGDTASALKHWKTALSYNPNDRKLKNNIEFLSRPRP